MAAVKPRLPYLLLPENALRQMMTDAPDVQELLADAKGIRFYPHKAPQKTERPYVIYSRHHSTPYHNLSTSGDTNPSTRSNLHRYEFALSLFCDTAEMRRALQLRICLALDGFRGITSSTEGDYEWRGLTVMSDEDDFLPPEDKSDGGLFVSHIMITGHSVEDRPFLPNSF